MLEERAELTPNEDRTSSRVLVEVVSSTEIPMVFSSRTSIVMFLALANSNTLCASTLETVKVSKKFP